MFQVSVPETDIEAIRQMARHIVCTSSNMAHRAAASKTLEILDSLEAESRAEAWITRLLMKMHKTNKEAHLWLGVGMLALLCAMAALLAVLT